MDKLTKPERSAQMALVRSKDTKPEMLVRRLVHGMGYRYRLHDRRVPGAPDLVFPNRRGVVFIHGCFWHGHDCRRGSRVPATNRDYWLQKIGRNRARDTKVLAELACKGWNSLVIWECELRDRPTLSRRIAAFLGPVRSTSPRGLLRIDRKGTIVVP
jgi:DNA mismatch endonuclease (patch repair protein)